MFGRGATDINDLITNTVGTCIGYGIYTLLSKLAGQRSRPKFQAEKINATAEVLLFTAYAFLIMITLQPLVIHEFFRLG